MDVISVADKVWLIANLMLPKAALPNSLLLFMAAGQRTGLLILLRAMTGKVRCD